MAEAEAFAGNARRTAAREQVEDAIASVTRTLSRHELIGRLQEAKIAFGVVNEPADVLEHPALRMVQVTLPNGEKARIPAPPVASRWIERDLGACPALGGQTEAVRREFGDA
jgi:crotonobetainyl-CoA:carnitine CoA-transferase CaiB-like acyl-CoA transferase